MVGRGEMLEVWAATAVSKVQAATDVGWRVTTSGAWKRKEGGRRERAPAAGEMTALLTATLDASGDVAAGLTETDGTGVALPCTSARLDSFLVRLQT